MLLNHFHFPRRSIPWSRPHPRGLRRRSSTFTAIAAWAAHVQPGSPASLSPRSSHRYPSLRKGRRPSVASICTASTSFLHIAPTQTAADVASPSLRDFKADLTTVGYTSVFLHLPNTPISTTLSFCIAPPSPNAYKKIAIPPIPSSPYKSLPRFRSFLRSRTKSKSTCPNSPIRMKAKADAASTPIVKRKKAKHTTRPPPLDNELAVMQFVDGGSTESNIKRIVEARAKATGVVADVYRDGQGGIWWDQDEEWEYTHLLAEGDESRPRGASDLQWVTFDGNTSPSVTGVLGEDRRGSVSTQGSDLDPKRVVQPMDLLYGNGFGCAVAPPMTGNHPTPLRPRRIAQDPDFLVDAAFPRSHAFPKSAKSPNSPGVVHGPQGKARRRPAPLQLSPPTPASKRPTNSPIDADKIRKDFIDASFHPACPVPDSPVSVVSMSTPVDSRVGDSRAISVPWRTANRGLGMKKKPSMLNMMGLFRSAKKEDAMC